MTRYILHCGQIAISKDLGYGCASITVCKRVPRPVRLALRDLTAPSEVEYDTKNRQAKIVPLWELRHGW